METEYGDLTSLRKFYQSLEDNSTDTDLLKPSYLVRLIGFLADEVIRLDGEVKALQLANSPRESERRTKRDIGRALGG